MGSFALRCIAQRFFDGRSAVRRPQSRWRTGEIKVLRLGTHYRRLSTQMRSALLCFGHLCRRNVLRVEELQLRAAVHHPVPAPCFSARVYLPHTVCPKRCVRARVCVRAWVSAAHSVPIPVCVCVCVCVRMYMCVRACVCRSLCSPCGTADRRCAQTVAHAAVSRALLVCASAMLYGGWLESQAGAHCIAPLRCIALHHCAALRCAALRCAALHCIAPLRCAALRCTALHAAVE
jgi:hypothetical protein